MGARELYIPPFQVFLRFKTRKGLDRGDRIGMYAVNHYEWIVTQLAAAKAGLILVKDAHSLSMFTNKTFRFEDCPNSDEKKNLQNEK